jgi:hypothetical protein
VRESQQNAHNKKQHNQNNESQKIPAMEQRFLDFDGFYRQELLLVYES